MKSMDQMTIPETTITPEQYAVNARQLVAAIMLQATRDYCANSSEPQRDTIRKELRSTWMDTITDGNSKIIAEQLELHPEEIAERLRLHHEIN